MVIPKTCLLLQDPCSPCRGSHLPVENAWTTCAQDWLCLVAAMMPRAWQLLPTMSWVLLCPPPSFTWVVALQNTGKRILTSPAPVAPGRKAIGRTSRSSLASGKEGISSLMAGPNLYLEATRPLLISPFSEPLSRAEQFTGSSHSGCTMT